MKQKQTNKAYIKPNNSTTHIYHNVPFFILHPIHYQLYQIQNNITRL